MRARLGSVSGGVRAGFTLVLRRLFRPYSAAWEAWEGAAMTCTRVLFGTVLGAFGVTIWLHPAAFDVGVYRFLLSWASPPAWAFAAVAIAYFLVRLPERERVAVRQAWFVAFLYFSVVAAAVSSTPRGFSPYTALLSALALICLLASSRIGGSHDL